MWRASNLFDSVVKQCVPVLTMLCSLSSTLQIQHRVVVVCIILNYVLRNNMFIAFKHIYFRPAFAVDCTSNSLFELLVADSWPRCSISDNAHCLSSLHNMRCRNQCQLCFATRLR